MYSAEERKRITNRHIAILLTKFDETEAPQVLKDAAKKEMWHLSDDLDDMYRERK